MSRIAERWWEISRAEQIRQAVVDYVGAAHRAYAAAVPPPGGLLRGDPFCVLAVAAGDLHLIATRQALGPSDGVAAAALDGAADGLRWQIRFFDALLVPELSQVAPGPDAPAEVRRLLGITTWLYHLAAPPARLSAHHARHTGLALAGTGMSPV